MAGRVAEGAARGVEASTVAEPLRTMRARDGFVLALTMPAALVATLGYSIASLGTWAATALWGVSMVIAILANLAYAELAGMFPHKPGGISLYAWEGWRSRFTLAGPVATFGYWFAWSSSMAVFAGIAGDLVQAEWFTGQDWTWDAGVVDVTFARLVAAAILVVVWAANVLGVTPTLTVAYATAAMLLVPLTVFMVVPYLTGEWSSATFTSNLGDGGWRLGVVWLYVMLWTSLGVEACATFTPEYRRGAHDATLALRASALFSLGVFVLLPLGAAGAAGQPAVVADPLTFYIPAFEELVGGAADVMVLLLVGSLLLVINTSMADSSRALYGIAADGMAPRQLESLNRYGVPARTMTVDLLLNLALLFFLGSTLAIVAAGNLGYVAAHVLALAAFVLLRLDRPAWPRPFALPRWYAGVATALAAALAFVLAIGATSYSLTGYGGARELAVALGIIGSSLLLFAYRRVLQDRLPLRLREPDDSRQEMGPSETAA